MLHKKSLGNSRDSDAVFRISVIFIRDSDTGPRFGEHTHGGVGIRETVHRVAVGCAQSK